MTSCKPRSGPRVPLAIVLAWGLAGCAEVDNLLVQVGSSRAVAVLQVQAQRLDAVVTLSPDRTGTLNAQASQGQPGRCMGLLRFLSSTQGDIDMRCNDGTTAILQFSLITAVKGYAYGTSNNGPVALAFGMSDEEARAYLPAPTSTSTDASR